MRRGESGLGVRCALVSAVVAIFGLLAFLSLPALAQGPSTTLLCPPAPAQAAPPNDDFADAQVLIGLPTLTIGTNCGATPEPGEPTLSYGSGSSVWYAWTALASGQVRVSTEGTRFDTTLAVYTGSSFGSLTYIGSNNDTSGDSVAGWDGLTSAVDFTATSGTTYRIAVDGAVGSGFEQGLIQLGIEARGSISGNVTDESTNPLEDICVGAWEAGSGDFAGGGYTYTDANGDYEIDSLPSGDYKVGFYDCGSNNVLGEYYDDKPDFDSADAVRVTAGQTRANTDAVLAAVDTTAPETTIDTGPSGTANDNGPTFTFSSSEPDGSFECKLDAGAFAACGSPETLAALGDGAHTFHVRATDQAANTDPTPASRDFTVDTTPPDTTIDSGPSGTTNDTTPTFGFSSSDPGTFECRFDSAAFGACSGPDATHTAASAHATGVHTFEVRATDAAGNTDATPANRTFTINAPVAPSPTDPGPSDPGPVGGDGVADEQDSCPTVANSDDRDTDRDGSGDACDPDENNDRRLDDEDRCPLAQATTTDGCPENVVPDSVAPALTGFRLRHRSFKATKRAPSIVTRGGAIVSYKLSEPATVTFAVRRQIAGRKVAGKCKRAIRKNRRRPPCKIFRLVSGTFTHTGVAGPNSFHFSGWIAGKELGLGSYRLGTTPVDAAGNAGPSGQSPFTVR